MEVYIPSFRYEESELERGYTVSRAAPGRARPARLKKCIRTPEIPSKHVRNWVPKVLEQRRQGLELYLQVSLLSLVWKLFLLMCGWRHLNYLPCIVFTCFLSLHVVIFKCIWDSFSPNRLNDFPNVVIEGILHGIFYPHLLPR
uniref:Sorting nexin 24 n=1 Tax=Pavo cristatus TaxID=9049 RepID=A0A8C9EQQ4_PAVCR